MTSDICRSPRPSLADHCGVAERSPGCLCHLHVARAWAGKKPWGKPGNRWKHVGFGLLFLLGSTQEVFWGQRFLFFVCRWGWNAWVSLSEFRTSTHQVSEKQTRRCWNHGRGWGKWWHHWLFWAQLIGIWTSKSRCWLAKKECVVSYDHIMQAWKPTSGMQTISNFNAINAEISNIQMFFPAVFMAKNQFFSFFRINLFSCIYIYIYISILMYIYIYIYTYTHSM